MKKFRKLIPAFIMLLVSAILVSTATYAWFSMNNSVTATGMSISAKNESGSLIIGATTYTGTTPATPTLTGVQTANLTTVDLSQATYNYTTDFAVKPSAHAAKTTIADLDSVANWSYKTADAPSNYASSAVAGTALTTFSGYVLYYDLYLTVATGSPAMANLKCNATIQASGATDEVRNGVRVLVASDTDAEEFFNTHIESGTNVDAHTQGTVVLASSITSAALTHIRVYIYLDGEDSTVFTNNFTNLKSATVTLSFTAENTNP